MPKGPKFGWLPSPIQPMKNPDILRVGGRQLHGLPDPPESVDWTAGLNGERWRWYGNNHWGDCAFAAAARLHSAAWKSAKGKAHWPDSGKLISQYLKFRPNDGGMTMEDCLTYWLAHGIGGAKIQAWAAIDTTDMELIRKCMWVFGPIWVGWPVFKADMDQYFTGQPWTNTDIYDPTKLVGGHAMALVQYSPGGLGTPPWNRIQLASWDWARHHLGPGTGAVVVSRAWIGPNGRSPSGFTLRELMGFIGL